MNHFLDIAFQVLINITAVLVGAVVGLMLSSPYQTVLCWQKVELGLFKSGYFIAYTYNKYTGGNEKVYEGYTYGKPVVSYRSITIDDNADCVEKIGMTYNGVVNYWEKTKDNHGLSF